MNPPPTPPFGRARLLAELEDRLGTFGRLLLWGPPGVGKTRLARELARAWTDAGGLLLHVPADTPVFQLDPFPSDPRVLLLLDRLDQAHPSVLAHLAETPFDAPESPRLLATARARVPGPWSPARVRPVDRPAALEWLRAAIGDIPGVESALEPLVARLDNIPDFLELAARHIRRVGADPELVPQLDAAPPEARDAALVRAVARRLDAESPRALELARALAALPGRSLDRAALPLLRSASDAGDHVHRLESLGWLRPALHPDRVELADPVRAALRDATPPTERARILQTLARAALANIERADSPEALELPALLAQLDPAELPTTPDTVRLAHETAHKLAILGRHDAAAPLAERALVEIEARLGPRHPLRAAAAHNLGTIRARQNRPDEALPLHNTAAEIWTRAFGPEHPRAKTALKAVERAKIRIAREFAPKPETPSRPEPVPESPPSSDPETPAPPRRPETPEQPRAAQPPTPTPTPTPAPAPAPAPLRAPAAAATLAPSVPDAESAPEVSIPVRSILDRIRRAAPKSDPESEKPPNLKLATLLNNKAWGYVAKNRLEDAEELFLRSLKLREETLGPAHQDLAVPHTNLAGLYRRAGRLEDAETHYRQALKLRESALHAWHPEVAKSLNNLAGFYESAGRFDDALPLFRRALEILENTCGPDHEVTAVVRRNLAALEARLANNSA